MVKRRNISNDLRILLHNPHLFSSVLKMGSDNFKWEISWFSKIFPSITAILWLLPSYLMINVPLKRKKQKDLFFQALCLVLGWSTFGTNYSHKLCTPGFEDNLPLFSADPLRLWQGWMRILGHIQVGTFNNIQSCPRGTPALLSLWSLSLDQVLEYSSTPRHLAFPQPWLVSIFKPVKHTRTSRCHHHASLQGCSDWAADFAWFSCFIRLDKLVSDRLKNL